MRIQRATRKKLGQILMDANLLTEAEVESVLTEQRETNELFGDILIARGLVTETNIAQAIVTQYHLPFVRLASVEISDKVKNLFPEGILRRYQFIPFDRIGDVILVACAGSIDVEVLEKLQEVSDCVVRVYVTTVTDVKKAIEDHFKEGNAFSEIGMMFFGQGDQQ